MSGGHVLTQNQFLKDVNLESILKDIDELIIGISAGSMNSAKIVYCQPELEEITYPDSIGREFYALVDGSNIFGDSICEEVWGESYLIEYEMINKNL